MESPSPITSRVTPWRSSDRPRPSCDQALGGPGQHVDEARRDRLALGVEVLRRRAGGTGADADDPSPLTPRRPGRARRPSRRRSRRRGSAGRRRGRRARGGRRERKAAAAVRARRSFIAFPNAPSRYAKRRPGPIGLSPTWSRAAVAQLPRIRRSSRREPIRRNSACEPPSSPALRRGGITILTARDIERGSTASSAAQISVAH